MTERNSIEERKTNHRKRRFRMLDTAGCGIFFIWIGVAILANLGWGIGLIGVGLLILGLLAVRVYRSDAADSRTTNACC